MKKILKIASAVPALKVADVDFNTQEIIRCAEKALEAGAELIVFPHLAVTGSTCGDLFQYSLLQDAAENALVQVQVSLDGKYLLCRGNSI